MKVGVIGAGTMGSGIAPICVIDKEDVFVANIHVAGTISCNSLNVCCLTSITSRAASRQKTRNTEWH